MVRRILVSLPILLAISGPALAEAPPQYLLQWGTYGSGPRQFMLPSDIVVVGDVIYVADTFNARVQKFSPEGAYLGEWSTEGPSDGVYRYPHYIASDADGNLWLASIAMLPGPTAARVQKFDSSGNYLGRLQSNTAFGDLAVAGDGTIFVGDAYDVGRVAKFDAAGDSIGYLQISASSIAIDSNDIFYGLVPSGPSAVYVLTTSGSHIDDWGTFGTGPGEVPGALGLSVDDEGKLYISGGNQVAKFDGTGMLLSQWGESGSGDGQFLRPEGVAIGGGGFIYVVDEQNNRVQKFAPGAVPTVPTTWGAIKAARR